MGGIEYDATDWPPTRDATEKSEWTTKEFCATNYRPADVGEAGIQRCPRRQHAEKPAARQASARQVGEIGTEGWSWSLPDKERTWIMPKEGREGGQEGGPDISHGHLDHLATLTTSIIRGIGLGREF